MRPGPPARASANQLSRFRVAVALAVVLGLGGCTEGPRAGSPQSAASPAEAPATPVSPTAAAPTAPRAPKAPALGGCHRLTIEQAARPTDETGPVRCAKPHTSYTFHVGRLRTVVKGHSLAVDSDRVRRQVAHDCLGRLDGLVGGTPESRRLSRFQVVWFSPTLAQFDAGADWFRCDVVALATRDRLLRLPGGRKLNGVLDRPGALDSYGLCGTAQPGARRFERVACALKHSWVAISTIAIPGRDRYPGVAAVRRAGDQPCSDQVRRRNALALRFDYGWEWPTRKQWAAGQRHGFCWAPSSRR